MKLYVVPTNLYGGLVKKGDMIPMSKYDKASNSFQLDCGYNIPFELVLGWEVKDDGDNGSFIQQLEILINKHKL